MEGRWPAARARQGSDSPRQPCTPHPCSRAAQRPPGREPASAQRPRPPEKGASVTRLLRTGRGGVEKTQPGQPGCRVRPSPGWRPCSPRTRAQAWQRGQGRWCPQAAPVQAGGPGVERSRAASGSPRGPGCSAPSPGPPGPPAAAADRQGPRRRRLRSGRRSRAVQRQQPPFPSSRSTQPLHTAPAGDKH